MKFPIEIFPVIASFARPSVLAAFMSTSKDLNHIAGPILYHTITITEENASKILEGMIRSDIPFRKGDIQVPRSSIFTPSSSSTNWCDIYLTEPDQNEADDTRQEYSKSHSRYPAINPHYSNKVKLLSCCKKMIFRYLPLKSFWQDITRLVLGNEVGVKPSEPFFKNVHIICIEPDTVTGFLYWAGRHGRKTLEHHFFARIYHMTQVEHICIVLPKVTETDFQDFTGSLEEDPDWPPLETQQRIRMRYSQFVSQLLSPILAIDDQPHGTLRSITIHNFVPVKTIHLKTPQRRIFLAKCQCKEISREKSCFLHGPESNHTNVMRFMVDRDVEYELSRLNPSSQASTQQFKVKPQITERFIEFVLCPQSYITENEIEDLKDYTDLLVDDRINYVAEITRRDEAVDCVCCGSKEGI